MKIERHTEQNKNPLYKYNRYAWKVLHRPVSKNCLAEANWCLCTFDPFVTWSYTPQMIAVNFDDRWIYWFTTSEQTILFKLRWSR